MQAQHSRKQKNSSALMKRQNKNKAQSKREIPQTQANYSGIHAALEESFIFFCVSILSIWHRWAG